MNAGVSVHTLDPTEPSCVTAFQRSLIMAEEQSPCVARGRVCRGNLYLSLWSVPHQYHPPGADPGGGCRRRDSAQLVLYELVS